GDRERRDRSLDGGGRGRGRARRGAWELLALARRAIVELDPEAAALEHRHAPDHVAGQGAQASVMQDAREERTARGHQRTLALATWARTRAAPAKLPWAAMRPSARISARVPVHDTMPPGRLRTSTNVEVRPRRDVFVDRSLRPGRSGEASGSHHAQDPDHRSRESSLR